MKEETLKRIFEFIKENSKQNLPLFWKMKNDIPLTEKDLNIEGDLNLSNLKITSLPKGLKVGGNLTLGGTKIKSLPEGLEVGGFLDLGHSNITSLPKGLKVGGNLYIPGCPLEKLWDKQIRKMINPDGYIIGKIQRW
jgi:hypothetical protein